MGLRLKFNLVIVPLVALMTAAMVWLDYRHELVSVVVSHGVHGGVAGTSVRGHIVYGMTLLLVLVAGVNATLDVLVLRPIARMRSRLVGMERGHWREAAEPTTDDEMGRFVRSLDALGPEIGALVGQSLQAERLAVLALLSHYLRGELEPDVQGVAQVAVQLNGGSGTDRREAAHELARRAASMFTTIRGLDRAFPGGVTNRVRR